MEKPIIVTIGRGHPDDLVEIIEDNGEKTQRMGLSKHVESSYISRSFNDLLDYMLDPCEDELNKAYSPTELELSQAIQGMQSAGNLTFIPKLDGEFDSDFIIAQDAIVGDYLERILERKELSINGDTIPYDSIDLKIRGAYFGG